MRGHFDQVDGTKVDKTFERGGAGTEVRGSESSFNCSITVWLLSFLRCKCCECPGCPKCPRLTCPECPRLCPECPRLCGSSNCCFGLSMTGQGSNSMSGQDSSSRYELQARTVKALQEILFTEAKL
jgi:hypothetical protein